jgi:hypothetical protein
MVGNDSNWVVGSVGSCVLSGMDWKESKAIEKDVRCKGYGTIIPDSSAQ